MRRPSHPPAEALRLAGRYGIGADAIRLLSASDIIELTGCAETEASAIVKGSASSVASPAATSAGLTSAGPVVDTSEGGALSEAEASAVFGYPIDDFQRRTLAVIVQPGLDLLAMAAATGA